LPFKQNEKVYPFLGNAFFLENAVYLREIENDNSPFGFLQKIITSETLVGAGIMFTHMPRTRANVMGQRFGKPRGRLRNIGRTNNRALNRTKFIAYGFFK